MAPTCAVILILVAAFIAPAQEKQTNTHEFLGLGAAPDQAAAKAGASIYAQNCAACHGRTARGAQGPNLVRSPLVLHDEKGEEIGQLVKQGRPSAGMPPFPDLTTNQLYQIAEYIHLQVELAANRGTYRDTYSNFLSQATGDPIIGQQFFTSNCTGCHSVSGDLAKIGQKYPQASVMISRIAWPVSLLPKHATVKTATGTTLTGTLIHMDDFDVAFKDDSGEYHSWSRDEVKVDVPDNLLGHRALLAKYTDADLHNLTAYLVTLK